MTDNIDALRAALFDTLRGLKTGDCDIDRARAINETAQVIINTAKVEIDHLRLTGTGESQFIAPAAPPPALGEQASLTQHGAQTITEAPGVRVIRHQMR